MESLIQLKVVKSKLRASIKALDAKEVEESREALKSVYTNLKLISTKLNASLTTLNMLFTENMSKRQLDALGARGPSFKYEKAQNTEEIPQRQRCRFEVLNNVDPISGNSIQAQSRYC